MGQTEDLLGEKKLPQSTFSFYYTSLLARHSLHVGTSVPDGASFNKRKASVRHPNESVATHKKTMHRRKKSN